MNLIEKGICDNGHPITSEADVFVQKRKTRSTTLVCKVCKRKSVKDMQARARGEYVEPRRIKPTILQLGECKRGHPIRGEQDVYFQKKTDRNLPSLGCRVCSKESVQNFRARCRDLQEAGVPFEEIIFREVSRFVSLSCGCERLYHPPLPLVDDLVYCTLHNDEAKIQVWGRKLRDPGSH